MLASNESRLGSLYFTRCTSGRSGGSDTTFCDAITVGGYPCEQKIVKIDSITVYSADMDVIVGLIVTYQVREGHRDHTTTTVTVAHGDVISSKPVGTLEIAENELLVGAAGQLKNAAEPGSMNSGRLSFIEFIVYDRDTARTTVRGPFGNTADLGTSWGSYGPILALEGTAGKTGLTTLGFTRLVHGVPEFGILGH